MNVRALPGPRSRSPVRERTGLASGYWRLLSAGAVSQAGTQVSALAIPLVAVLVLGASAAQIGLLTAGQSGAYLVAGLPAGIVADRLAHRSILLACDVGRAAAMASVPITAALAVLTLPQLYAVVCLTGVLSVFADVARQSAVPQLVSADLLQTANARLAATQSVASAAGPGVAGFLIQLAGPALAVAADAVSYVGSAFMIAGMDRVRPPEGSGRSLGARAWSGLRFPFSTRSLRDLVISSAVYNFLTAVGGVVLIVRLARDLQLPAAAIGLLYSVGALGGIAGAVTSRRVSDRFGTGAALCGSLLAASAGAFLIAAVGPTWRIALGAAGLFVSGAGVAVYNITQITLRQRLTPPELLGRTTGSIRLVVTGVVSLGALAGGTLATATSPATVLWLAAAGSLTATLVVAASPLRRLDPGPPRPQDAQLRRG